jgi:integrase
MDKKRAGLSDQKIRQAKPQEKPYNLYDTAGLYLTIAPTGAKWWRMKYRHAGTEKRMGLGSYPEVSLSVARASRDTARAAVRSGRDPVADRKLEKQHAELSAGNTFGAIAREWLDHHRLKLAAITISKAEWMIGLVPALEDRPIRELSAPEILAALRKIESTGKRETAHRVKQRIGQVFRYAVATGRADRDPTGDLRGALAPVVTTSHPALTHPTAVRDLLKAIDAYHGQPSAVAALKLGPMLFARPGNLRAMEWAELDLEAGEWRIPANKMKMREAHVVPLASQAVAILRELRTLNGRGCYCFPSVRTPDRPMSENTINAALRSMGFDKETMTGHGFRALASTMLNELGWSPDVIERQLAHAERNKVRAVYNRAQYMAERKKMMQAWADWLDALRVDNKVAVLKRRAVAT